MIRLDSNDNLDVVLAGAATNQASLYAPYAEFELHITQDATGSRTAACPFSFAWADGSASALSTAGSSVDVLALTTFNQGTTWNATLAKAFA